MHKGGDFDQRKMRSVVVAGFVILGKFHKSYSLTHCVDNTI